MWAALAVAVCALPALRDSDFQCVRTNESAISAFCSGDGASPRPLRLSCSPHAPDPRRRATAARLRRCRWHQLRQDQDRIREERAAMPQRAGAADCVPQRSVGVQGAQQARLLRRTGPALHEGGAVPAVVLHRLLPLQHARQLRHPGGIRGRGAARPALLVPRELDGRRQGMIAIRSARGPPACGSAPSTPSR